MLKKLFGGLKLTWPLVILFAVAAGVFTALMAMYVPDGNSFHEIAVLPEAWVLFAILILTNCDKPLEAALKTFVFFLISQPLVYLIQVPFNSMGWSLFGYYRFWFLITLLTFPGAYLGWYVKKDNVWSGLILSVMTVLLAYLGVSFLEDLLRNFPNHLISVLFCFGTAVLLILGVLRNKRARLLAGGITLAALIVFSILTFGKGRNVRVSGNVLLDESIVLDGSWSVRVEDEAVSSASIEKSYGDAYQLKMQFYLTGDNTVILTDPAGKTRRLIVSLDEENRIRVTYPDNPLMEIRERGILRVGATGDYQPMSWLDPANGQYEGFDAELAADLAKALGVELEFVPTSWPTLMEDTLAGKFDLALCGITVTEARKAQALMSEGYLGNGKTLLCRAEDADKYTSLEAVDRPEVRVMENPGGLNEQFARENLPHAQLILHEANQEIPDLIAAGEADVMITETLEAGWYAGRDSRLAAPLIYEPFTRGQLGALLPKGSEELLDYVNSFLEQEKASGRIDALAEEYVFHQLPRTEPPAAAAEEPVGSLSREGYTLEQVVVLSRHNIRSPLSGNGSLLDSVTPHEWFAWSSKPSELSLRGGVLETEMGQYFRKWLEAEGLFPENYHPEAGAVRIYANSKQRTIATAQYFASGLLPTAKPEVETHGDFDRMDPVFNPQFTFTSPAYNAAAEAQALEICDGAAEELAEAYQLLADVIDLEESEAWRNGTVSAFRTDDTVLVLETGQEPGIKGSLKTACPISDALVLQYYEEADPVKAGFGQALTVDQWRRISAVKDVYGDVLFTAPLIAVNVAHPLLQEIEAELKAEGRVFTFLCGHDANVGSVLAALGAEEYELPGAVEAKTPIGCKLVICRWRDAEGESWCSVDLVYQTAEQLRTAPLLDLEQHPAAVPMRFTVLPANADGLYRERDLLNLLHDRIEDYDRITEDYALPDAA